MRFLVNILTIGTLIISPLLKSQDINSYNVNASLNIDEKSIEVSQIMKFKNTSNIILNEIFLEDWSNSYINNETKLAKRISDEYSRSFSFAKKRQRGYTLIDELKSDNVLSWNRYQDQSDLIRIKLEEPLEINESISIELKYTIKLPDSKFTGFGYDDKNFYLKNWIIVFSNIYQDNTSVIDLIKAGRPTSHRTRHLKARYFFLKDYIKEGEVEIRHMGTDWMLADYLTKPLGGEKFIRFRDSILGLVDSG